MKRDASFAGQPGSFDAFLDELAAAFARVPAPEVDEEIQRWLERLVTFFGADRGAVGEFTPNGLVVTHGWAKNGRFPYSGAVERVMPYLVSRLRRGEMFVFSHPDEIPAEALEELELVARDKLKSHASVPLMLSGTPIGGLAIGCTEHSLTFPDEVLQRFRVVGTVFANAVARKRAVEEYRHVSRTLEHAGRVAAVGQLASSFAHEVKQPLGASLTNAQTALRLLDAPNPDLAEIRAALEDIAADNRRASDIVNELRRFLRRQEPSLGPIGVVELLDAVVRFVSPEARTQKVKIEIEIGGGLSGVVADRVQIQQVFVNLLLNAFDALDGKPLGERRVRLSAVAVADDRVAISVSDSGPGVPPAQRARLFEPFVTTKPQGLGIGLAISQTILLAHGDGLVYSEAPGGGARFTFTLAADPGRTNG